MTATGRHEAAAHDRAHRLTQALQRKDRVETRTTELVADPSVVAAVSELQCRVAYLEQCLAQLGADMTSSVNALNAKIDHEIETHDHKIQARLEGNEIIIGGRVA
jgi:hypothetical protein